MTSTSTQTVAAGVSAEALRRLNASEISFVEAERQWTETARDKQILPITGWNLAVALSGRGFGKTLMGASWARRVVGMYPGCVVHVIAPTYGDLRGVVFGGVSGLIAVIPAPMIKDVNHSLFEIQLHNGSLIRGFSAEAPNRMRGPQCTFVWGDEVAAWGPTAEEMLTNIDMSTRIVYKTKSGQLIQPQRFYTSTPRPLAWLKEMVEREDVLVIRGSTYENRDNLAESFIKELERYEGTQIGRQEIHGDLIDVGESAIIKRSWLNIWRGQKLPWFEFVFVSLDTALTERTFDKKTFEPDYTACTVWGVFAHDRRYHLMLLEAWRDRLGFPELIMRARREMRAVYGKRTFRVEPNALIAPIFGHEQIKRPDLMIIEDKGSGISLRQMLANEGQDTWPYNPGNADKTSRLHGVSHVAAARRIWLPESRRTFDKPTPEPRDWCLPMLDEVCVFSGPGTTKHDDFVDSFSQAVRFFADRWLDAGVMNPNARELGNDSMVIDVDITEPRVIDVEPPYG